MYEAESHEMELRSVDETGAEEWYCPTCGRRFIMRWPPDYARTILEPGDEYVTHIGGKGGLQMGGASITKGASDPLSEEIADLWRTMLDKIDLDGEDEIRS